MTLPHGVAARRGKYCVRIMRYHKLEFLGAYDTPEEASEAYQAIRAAYQAEIKGTRHLPEVGQHPREKDEKGLDWLDHKANEVWERKRDPFYYGDKPVLRSSLSGGEAPVLSARKGWYAD